MSQLGDVSVSKKARNNHSTVVTEGYRFCNLLALIKLLNIENLTKQALVSVHCPTAIALDKLHPTHAFANH